MQPEDYVFFLFCIAVLTQLVKLGDFLLTPSRQADFQTRVDSAVRFLATMRPIKVFTTLRSRRGKWVIVLPIVVVGSLWVLIILRGQVRDILARGSWSLSVAWDAALEALGMLIGTVALIYLATWVWRFETRAFLDAVGVRRAYVAVRAIGITAVGFVPFAIVVVRQNAAPAGELGVSTAFLVASMVTFMIAVNWLAPALAIVLAVTLWLLAIMGYGVIWLLRAVGIRIVQYQKGAWQAVLMLVTVALGIAVAYLKFMVE